MKRLVVSRCRIVLALLTAFGLLGVGMEPLLPDTHDGDGLASAAQVTEGTANDRPASIPTHSPDSPHVCHCLHVHLVDLTTGDALAAVARPDPSVPPFLAQHPALAPLPRHFRPPIA
jgi:hypothetical protein